MINMKSSKRQVTFHSLIFLLKCFARSTTRCFFEFPGCRVNGKQMMHVGRTFFIAAMIGDTIH